MQIEIIERSANFSPCRTWRYSLSRHWDRKKGFVLFVGLNPSTADELKDDPTIRRCMRFAHDWGLGGMVMANLFAFRATNPKDMMAAHDPIGPENDRYLWGLAEAAKIVLAAWGVHGGFKERDVEVDLAIHKNLFCLGMTKDGFPRHPLYVKANTKPVVYFF